MARKKGGGKGDGSSGNEWLNTYCDMVTLLLTFFVVLFSMSSLDSAKFNMMVKAFASELRSSDSIIIFAEGTEGTPTFDEKNPFEDGEREVFDMEEVFQMLMGYIEENQLTDSVQVAKGDGYVFIRFMDNMLFEANSARLKPADLEILNFVGYGIKTIQNQAELIRIDGHTAAIPENPNYEVSDRVLSSERANSILMYFEDVIGIDPKKLVQTAYGKQVPIADNNDPVERSRNRRVEIFISSENIMAEQLHNIYEQLSVYE